MDVVAWIELEGAVNVRELGGMPTTDGRRTASGKLLRADNLQDLSDADVKALVDVHGVSTVVDLRSTPEVESEGPTPLIRDGRVRHAQLSVLPEVGARTDVTADALATRRERNHARYPSDYMCGMYLGYLEDRPESVVAALREVNRADGAALIHCAAGKDRTGTVVALALAAVGVEPEAVVADYVATGERIEAILDRLRATDTYAADIDRIGVDAHTPRAATMQSFLQELAERHGGAESWLDKHGFGGDELQQLRQRLVDGSAGGSA